MTDTLTHALTIHQPYAWAISAGHKPIENRTWRPPLEAVGKLIGIHAGLGAGRDALGDYLAVLVAMGARRSEVPDMKWLQRGALIGVARLVGVVHKGLIDFQRMEGKSVSGSMPTELCNRIRPWWRGPYGWLWSNEPGDEPLLLPEPIPMRGQQGLWRVPEHCVRFDSEGHRCTVGVSDWALEQWRKARETR